MTEPTRQFFTRLSGQRQPFLAGLSGVVRFDIADGERTEHWYVTIEKGNVTVAHKGREPDCVLAADIVTFDAILTGKMNAMAAVLRGAMAIQGRVILLTALQRLFPSSAGAAEKPTAGYARRPS